MEIKCERGQTRSLPMASATTASSPCDVETEDNLQFWSGMVALLARATVYDLGIAGTGARILGFIAIGSGLNIVKLLPNEKSDNSANDTTHAKGTRGASVPSEIKAQCKEIGTPALAPRYRETQLVMMFDEGSPQNS